MPLLSTIAVSAAACAAGSFIAWRLRDQRARHESRESGADAMRKVEECYDGYVELEGRVSRVIKQFDHREAAFAQREQTFSQRESTYAQEASQKTARIRELQAKVGSAAAKPAAAPSGTAVMALEHAIEGFLDEVAGPRSPQEAPRDLSIELEQLQHELASQHEGQQEEIRRQAFLIEQMTADIDRLQPAAMAHSELREVLGFAARTYAGGSATAVCSEEPTDAVVELNRVFGRLEAQERELELLHDQIAASDSATGPLIEQLAEAERRHALELADKDAALGALAGEVESLQTVVPAQTSDELAPTSDELARISDELGTAQAELEGEEARRRAAEERALELEGLCEQVRAKKDEQIGVLQERMEAMQELHAQLEQREKDLEEIATRCESLERSKKRAATQTKQLREELAESEESVHELGADPRELRAERQARKDEINECFEALGDLAEELVERDKVHRVTEKLHGDAIREHESEVQDLRREAGRLQTVCDSAAAAVDALEALEARRSDS